MKRQLKQFPQYKQNEQSHKNTQHISISAIFFIMYNQSQKIVNQIIEIIGSRKPSQGSQAWLRSPMDQRGDPYA
jgi:hypothetical protein